VKLTSIQTRLSFGIGFLFFGLLVPGPTYALARIFTDVLSNRFIDMPLLDGWKCELQKDEWICQSLDFAKRDEAKIVIHARVKERDPKSSTLDFFLNKYGTPIRLAEKSGSIQASSRVLYAKKTTYQGREWADVLQFQSEFPGYFTRYLAAPEADIQVLIKFNYRKDKANVYGPLFEMTAGHLRFYLHAADEFWGTPEEEKKRQEQRKDELLKLFNGEGISGENMSPFPDRSKPPAKFVVECGGVAALIIFFIQWFRRKRSRNV